MASDSRDATILVINRVSYERVLMTYPEDHDLIVENLLLYHGLNKNGDDVRGGRQMEDRDEAEYILRIDLQAELLRRKMDASSALFYAAQKGEVQHYRVVYSEKSCWSLPNNCLG